MARPSGLRVTLSFISVLKFAVTIEQVAGALTLLLFFLCGILMFAVASTPGLATTPEDAVPVLGGFPSSGFDERSSFLPCNVQHVYMSPSNDAMPLHSKHGCFHYLSQISPL